MTEAADRGIAARDAGVTGKARQLLEKIDWSAHALGPHEQWPAALRVSLRNLLVSPEAMYILWGDDLTLFYNDACMALLSPSLDDCMAERFDRVWDGYESIEPMLRKAQAGISTRIVDMKVPLARGGGVVEDRWWTFSYAPLFDADGTIAGVQGVIGDTTAQVRRAEEQAEAAAVLAATESGLRRAQQAGRIGVFGIDIRTGLLSGSDEFFRLFGLPETGRVPASTIEAMVIPEDRSRISDEQARATETAPLHTEYRIRRPDTGEIRCIERRGEFEHDEGGHPIRLLGVVQDVTERRAAREALADLNATLEQRVRERTAERNMLARIVEQTDAYVHVLDTDFRWLAVNPAGALEFERVFGVRPKVGDHILDLLEDQPAQRAQVEAIWSRALGGEEFTAVSEFGAARTAAESRSYEMKFNTLRDENGDRIGAFQVVTDITERVRADAAFAQMQEALRQSQKMEAMGQLTGGVAHDFNNLLTPIIGSLDLLQRREGLSDREARLIDGALQSAERAKTLVQRLLAFARRQPLQPGAVDMNALVGGMAELVASTSGPQVRIRTEIAAGLPRALADPNQLEMAILNLCVNARDAMPDGGTVTIAASVQPIPAECTEAKASGDHMRLSVIDTGIGMDEETRLRAIEPFYSTKGIGKGTGLGLSMVHGLAVQLGGAMTIASRPGLGTRVDLWLPLTEAVAIPAEPAPVVPASTVRGRVLVVDDEVLVRIAAVDMLQSLGYETEEADSAVKAEARLRAGERFDLVVTDHLMPGVTGAELAATIRRDWPELPVLIASGYADVEAIAPDIPRLAKPFREAELAQAIAALR